MQFFNQILLQQITQLMTYSSWSNCLKLLIWWKQSSSYTLLLLVSPNTGYKTLCASNITQDRLLSFCHQAVGTLELPKQSSLFIQPLMMACSIYHQGKTGCLHCWVVLLVHEYLSEEKKFFYLFPEISHHLQTAPETCLKCPEH